MAFRTTFDQRRLLVASVRGNLTGGSQDGLTRFNNRVKQSRDTLVLAYTSGRPFQLVIEDINNFDLIYPDYVISSVGTEIHRIPGEHLVDEWVQYAQQGFDPDGIIEFIGQYYPELEIQPDKYQSPLKISYIIERADESVLDKLERELYEHELPGQIIYSKDRYLDIIPERAGTGPAVKYIINSLVLTPGQVYVAGDSGNDIDLFQYGYRGVVVDNASHELKEAARFRAYFSHQSYAKGLLEGLEHYSFFKEPTPPREPDIAREAFERAVDSLRQNITHMGFSAASMAYNVMTREDSNYFSVWSRDGIQTGLWALSLNDPEFTECFRRTLELMVEHQSVTGQIPANVRIRSGKPDYGGIGDIASIDSVLWFVIGASRFAAHTRDRAFLERIYPSLRLAMSWLHAHDSNNNGLLEIPESSDWMDLFPRSYNVLYDEVLWYQACRDFSVISEVMGDDPHSYVTLTETISRKILRQFWPTAQKLSEARESFSETQFTLGDAQYLLAQISPFGFSWRCDVYANLLAGLVGLLDDEKMDRVFYFLWGVGANSPYPIKCYYPPINSGANDWEDYFVTNFLNLPNHYHNGGIWPFIGGLWVRFLAHDGRIELAHKELTALAQACRAGIYDEWEFNEWLHGVTGRPMGKAHQAWSSASYIMAWKSLNQETIPVDFEPLRPDMFDAPEE
jgi:sucrose-6F-phosphate phosphohydrolase